MKALVVSDLHDRIGWKQPVMAFLSIAEANDKVVFLGDYNDSFDLADGPILANFQAVLNLRRQYPTQVVLLLGNHCIPYLFYPDHIFRCAGFRLSIAPQLAKLYQAHAEYFQVAFAIKQTLLVHAGVSWQWLACNERSIKKLTNHEYFPTSELSLLLNKLLSTQAGRRLLWQTSPDNGGLDKYDSPLWVRPYSLLKNGLLVGTVQVVGHTEVNRLTRFVYTFSHTGFILTDCLGNNAPEWLTLELPNPPPNG